MKIAFLTDRFPVISKTFILDQITGLIDRSVDVDIYALQPGSELGKHPDYDYYNLNNRVFYQDKLCKDRIKLFPNLFFLNIRNNPIPVINSLNCFKYGKQAISLKHFSNIIPFLDNKYDIIHAHFGPLGIQAQFLRDLKAFNGKIVTSFHGFDMTVFVKRNGINAYQPLFAKGDIFLPISNYWKNRLISWGCDKKKIQVHHMGIKLDLFHRKSNQPVSKAKTHLISVGRLTEKKGFKYSIKAIKYLVRNGINVSYTIIGDGPLKKSLSELINELDLQGSVQLVGSKKRTEVVCLLKQSDIFILPSVTAKNGDMEGIPMVLMEAMATGLPVVSTYHSGIPELVKDGLTGFTVPEKDVSSIAEKVCEVIRSPTLVDRITREATRHIRLNFNVETQNNKLLQIYKNLM